jgi:hypothetical protein
MGNSHGGLFGIAAKGISSAILSTVRQPQNIPE